MLYKRWRNNLKPLTHYSADPEQHYSAELQAASVHEIIDNQTLFIKFVVSIESMGLKIAASNVINNVKSRTIWQGLRGQI